MSRFSVGAIAARFPSGPERHHPATWEIPGYNDAIFADENSEASP